MGQRKLWQTWTWYSCFIETERFLYGLEKWFWLVFVICFLSQWMKRTKHGLFVFPPMKTLNNLERALFNWLILLQYDVEAYYQLISRKFSGMKFFTQTFT